MVVAATEEQIQVHQESDPETESPPVVALTMVSQPGLPRRQVYYPYISCRLSRVLQARRPHPPPPHPFHPHPAPQSLLYTNSKCTQLA